MVYTERVWRRQQFHVASAMLQLNSAVSSPHIGGYSKRAIKSLHPLIRNHMRDKSAVSLPESYIKAIANIKKEMKKTCNAVQWLFKLA